VTKISNLIQSSARWRSILLLAGGALVLGAIACSSDEPEPTAVPPEPTSAPAATAEPTAASDAMAGDAMMDDHSEDLMMAQAEASVIVPLDALNDSDQSGVAILLDKGDTTEVVIDIGSGAADVPQPIHIHAGNCDNLGDVAHALSDVVNGRSVTTVEASLAEITSGGFTINTHKSGDEIAVYVACGNVPSGADSGTFTLEAIDASGQHGSVSFIDWGDQTAVVISVGTGAAGIEQPVHIHAGTCDALGDVEHALTNVVDGRSMTVIDDSISNVMRDGFAVNLHRSGEEIAVYTACGAIGDAAMAMMADDAMDGGDAMMSDGSAVLSNISGFQLQTLSISVGDTVTWTNQDNAPHTVSHGLSPDVEASPMFQSGNFGKDGTFSHTFDTAGTFAYFCEVHPSMVGSITVK
jgi:plastocyanin